MSNAITLTTTLAVRTAPAIANKRGIITASATRTADIVNAMSENAIVGAAMSGKGAVGKTARAAIAYVTTLASLLSKLAIDGGQYYPTYRSHFICGPDAGGDRRDPFCGTPRGRGAQDATEHVA